MLLLELLPLQNFGNEGFDKIFAEPGKAISHSLSKTPDNP